MNMFIDDMLLLYASKCELWLQPKRNPLVVTSPASYGDVRLSPRSDGELQSIFINDTRRLKSLIQQNIKV